MIVGRNSQGNNGNGDLGHFLDSEVIPRLTVDAVFTHSSHNFQRSGDKLRGGCPWHESKSGTAFVIDAPTLRWWCPACCIGGGPVQYLHKLQGGIGVSPRGTDFVGIVRELCRRASVDMPERELSPEERKTLRRRDVRRAILESVYTLCARLLTGRHGTAARDYLQQRGFDDTAISELGLGLYPDNPDHLQKQLHKLGHDLGDILGSKVVCEKMAGFVVFPWRDERGGALTLYGKCIGSKPPEGRPKTMALANPQDGNTTWEQTKRSPLYLDRALKAGNLDLVLVEGVTDAALPQSLGDSRVIACVAAQLSKSQTETLARHKVRSVTIALDPDKAGDNGVLSCIRQLHEAGIAAYVAERLPAGMDPDEFIQSNGIDAWKAHTAKRVNSHRHIARAIIAQHGERQPGDDGWADGIIADAMGYARKVPSDHHGELSRHFFPEIVTVAGGTVEDLRVLLSGTNPGTNGTTNKTAPGTPGASGFTVNWIDSPTFFAQDCRPKWLVKRLLARGQPVIVGGPKKALKTSLLVDLAVSLGSGTKFLGHFDVYSTGVRVVLLSGESGEYTLQETGRRICATRSLDPAKSGVLWGFDLPQLANPTDLSTLRDGLQRDKVEVAIIDPLYLCLLAGQSELSASNLFDMGPVLLAAARACLSADCTPILVHHARKQLANPYEPLELEDLAFSGIQEFARQWLLLSRRKPYVPGTGSHQLWLSAGGSIGHGGLWALDIEEDVINEDFGGRKWEVTVTTSGEERDRKSAEKDRKKEQQIRDDGSRILAELDKKTKERGEAVSYTSIRTLAHLSNDRMFRAVEKLKEDEDIAVVELEISIGSGAKRTVQGLRRPPSGPSGQNGSTCSCPDGADL